MRRVFDDEPRSIAVVRPRTGLGDLLCTVPALRALRRRLPAAHVALVTFAEMSEVVERMRPFVDELLPFPGYPGIPERAPRRSEIAPFLAAARARGFDLALQMYGASAAAREVTTAIAARRAGGFLERGARAADTAAWIRYPEREHELRRHLRLMAHLGAEPDGEQLAFPILARDRDAAARLAAAVGMRAPYALLHAGATSPSRRWPPERFAAVAGALQARGLHVAVVGTRAERRIGRGIAAACVELRGRTDLGCLAALIEGAAIVVGNDSGPAHLAAALGTPSATVFLSGDPVRWAHGGPRHRVARVQVECNPCRHLECPIDHRCATRVSVEQVVAAADAALTAGRTIPPWNSISAAGGST